MEVEHLRHLGGQAWEPKGIYEGKIYHPGIGLGEEKDVGLGNYLMMILGRKGLQSTF